jgi:hypothetical protein
MKNIWELEGTSAMFPEFCLIFKTSIVTLSRAKKNWLMIAWSIFGSSQKNGSFAGC